MAKQLKKEKNIYLLFSSIEIGQAVPAQLERIHNEQSHLWHIELAAIFKTSQL